MWEKVLFPINANQILDIQSHTYFAVHLQLRDRYKDISVQNCARDVISIHIIVMKILRPLSVRISAIIVFVSFIHEGALFIKSNRAVAFWVSF